MALSWMTYGVSVTTGQTVTGWVQVGVYDEVLIALESTDAALNAHMILETCDEIVAGIGQNPQTVTLNQDVSAPPHGSVRYPITGNKFTYLRLSATSDGPGYSPCVVNGGILWLHQRRR